MGVEIERKFVAAGPPADLAPERVEAIQQGYLALEGGGREVRLRRRGDACSLTVKSAGGLQRQEWEIELTAEQLEALWPATEGHRVEKVRSVYRWLGRDVEVDVYEGHLTGLCTMEVEFPDLHASEAFEVPPWMGREVTGDKAYKNQRLATASGPPA